MKDDQGIEGVCGLGQSPEPLCPSVSFSVKLNGFTVSLCCTVVEMENAWEALLRVPETTDMR